MDLEKTMNLPFDDIEILSEFIIEASTHLTSVESSILLLEKSPDNFEILSEIFRSFHSIKGGAGFIGLKKIGNISHEIENLLDEARNNKLKVGTAVIDILFEGIDFLKGLMYDLLKNKGLSIPKDFDEIKKRGNLSGDDLSLYFDKIEKLLSDRKVEEEKKENYKKVGEILVEQKLVKPKDIENALNIQKRYVTKTSHEDIRVDMEKINNIVNTVGELVISYSLINQIGTVNKDGIGSKFGKEIVNHGKIVKQIQGQVMSMRMVPIKPTFQKMARLVRDLSKKQGKEVEFKTSGDDTEVDKTVIEEIGDPLVHIIRNAIDHGIEKPEERQRSGKPSKGSITINAYHKGGNIVIEIVDDGKGINKDKILKKGIDKGLIESGANLSDHDIFDILFMPGFSTAEKVTDVSGRGVGMDVVRRNVERLRGKVDISSEEEKGSTFTIRLPLTMAIIDGMVVTVGNERYIIPTFSIVESIRPKQDDISTVKNKIEMVKVRDRLFPMIRTYNLFGVLPKSVDPWESMIIVVEDSGKRACLLVDELIGQQQVVIKRLGSAFDKVKTVSGGGILGDGKVSLILDVERIIKSASGHA